MRNFNEVLLDPEECVVAIIDHQPQMYFGVESTSRAKILNNVAGLIKGANAFGVPVIITTVTAETFSGWLINKITEAFPTADSTPVPIDRTTINAWEDVNFKDIIGKTGRKRLILAGLWTEACVTFPALCAKYDGFDVYVVVDACGGATKEAHLTALSRMQQAGVKPVTWQQAMMEWQRDWADKTTYDAVMSVIKQHGGAYGLGVEYAETMGIE